MFSLQPTNMQVESIKAFSYIVVGWCRCFRGDEYSNSIYRRCI